MTGRERRRLPAARVNLLACAWGLAEATVFFIVPDVGLSLLVPVGLERALVAAGWALGGALAGGLMMLRFGAHAPAAARALLVAVPAVSPTLIAVVRTQLDAHGPAALMLGPLAGIPYKIYAVEWGARQGGWLTFLLVSIPARGARFFLLPAIIAGVLRTLRPLTRSRIMVEMLMIAGGWVAFYIWYFWRFSRY